MGGRKEDCIFLDMHGSCKNPRAQVVGRGNQLVFALQSGGFGDVENARRILAHALVTPNNYYLRSYEEAFDTEAFRCVSDTLLSGITRKDVGRIKKAINRDLKPLAGLALSACGGDCGVGKRENCMSRALLEGGESGGQDREIFREWDLQGAFHRQVLREDRSEAVGLLGWLKAVLGK